MNCLNKVMLIGFVGSDPELKQTGENKTFCKFTLATSEVYQKKQYTQWHNVTVWGKMANACGTYIKKGDPIFLEGKIQTTIRGEGAERKYYTGVVAYNISFLKPKNKGEGAVDMAKEMLGAEEAPPPLEEDGYQF